MSSVTQIEEAIQTVFEAAGDLARQTGFVQRVYPGKFDGKSFAATLVLGQIQQGEVSLSNLAHFATHLGVKVTGQGIDERYSKQAATFLHELLMVAFTQVVTAEATLQTRTLPMAALSVADNRYLILKRMPALHTQADFWLTPAPANLIMTEKHRIRSNLPSFVASRSAEVSDAWGGSGKTGRCLAGCTPLCLMSPTSLVGCFLIENPCSCKPSSPMR